MITFHRILLTACFVLILPFQVTYAEAPVVDESQNYAMLDDQQAALEQPVDKYQANYDEEHALVTDNADASSNSMLLNKLQGLQQELQELRGQLEVQAHDLKLLQQQQMTFYKDLDARIRNESPSKTSKAKITDLTNDAKLPTTQPIKPVGQSLEAKKVESQPVVTLMTSNTSHTNPADEQISYLAAYELVKNKRFDQAITAMQAFAEKYPQGGYTANAHYWLGELYMVKKNYPQAIEHFDVVLNKFPSSSKRAASLLKIGYALAASGKKQEARQRLQQVVKNYPDTNTAQLAKAKLETLGY